jgi:hypothetical protein
MWASFNKTAAISIYSTSNDIARQVLLSYHRIELVVKLFKRFPRLWHCYTLLLPRLHTTTMTHMKHCRYRTWTYVICMMYIRPLVHFSPRIMSRSCARQDMSILCSILWGCNNWKWTHYNKQSKIKHSSVPWCTYFQNNIPPCVSWVEGTLAEFLLKNSLCICKEGTVWVDFAEGTDIDMHRVYVTKLIFIKNRLK